MSGHSPPSPVCQRKKPERKKKSTVNVACPSSDSSPKLRRIAGAAAVAPEAAHVSSKPRSSRRNLFLNNPFLALQAKEDRGGISISGSENSSDDGDESDLSYISQTCDHANADRDVYLRSLSSQGGFPTPMHKRRQKDSGYMTVAGAII
jgi:hypothetical protein